MRLPTVKVPEYSDEVRCEFVGLITSHKNLIYHLIRKYSFIHEDEYDDYYQESVLDLWLNFGRYDQRICGFSTWMYKRVQWAILGYAKRSLKYCKRRVTVDTYFEQTEIADEPYNEDHLVSLRHAIADLPQKERRVVDMFLNGENLTENSISEGRKHHYYITRLNIVHRSIRNNRHKYFEGIKVNDRKLQIVPNGRVNEQHPNSRPIEMLSMAGEVIKTFPSIAEAQRQGFGLVANIQKCVHGERFSTAGHRWRFEGDPLNVLSTREKLESGRKKVPLAQKDASGNLIRVWSCMNEALKAGYKWNGINKSLTQGKKYRNCLWERA